ncbi:MAG: nuclear transport factor 2 family protein, partial [Gaiellaceae bacterium]
GLDVRFAGPAAGRHPDCRDDRHGRRAADGETYEARITSVEQVGDAATATLEETGCWGSVSFTDFFALSKIDGEWKIVSKTFAHTGGEMPTG